MRAGHQSISHVNGNERPRFDRSIDPFMHFCAEHRHGQFIILRIKQIQVSSYYRQGGHDNERILYNRQEIILPSGRSHEVGQGCLFLVSGRVSVRERKQRIFSIWRMCAHYILMPECEGPIPEVITDVSTHFLGKAQ
jgi:hypothetical protein